GLSLFMLVNGFSKFFKKMESIPFVKKLYDLFLNLLSKYGKNPLETIFTLFALAIVNRSITESIGRTKTVIFLGKTSSTVSIKISRISKYKEALFIVATKAPKKAVINREDVA